MDMTPANPTTKDRTALAITDLCKDFGMVKVLKHIEVAMAPGEFLVLVGPSGCGKSTLLNCIAGLEEVTSGTIEIAGRDVTRVPPRDRDIAMVFQSYALYPTMSVFDNIGFGMKVRKSPHAEIEKKVREVAGLLKIEPLLDRRPSQLSGGQRQRVAMGRALVRDPALFLFDEPLSNLDAKLRVEMRAEIKRLHQTTGTSIVYVTHDQIEAMTLATRIVVIKDGEVQQIGTPEEVYDRPANVFVADFMGSPPMNLIAATPNEDGKTLNLGDGHKIATTGLPSLVRGQKDLLVGIRPEHFGLAEENETAALNIAPTMVENSGSDAFVSFAIAGKPAIARLHGRFRQGADNKVPLTVDTETLCYFDARSGELIATQD